MVNRPAQWNQLTQTFANVGRQTAPAAGTVVADSGALPGGVWKVRASASYGPTADVIDNMSLFQGDKYVCDVPMIPVANSSDIPIELPAMVVYEGQHLTLRNKTTGGAGSVFRGIIVATPVQSLDPT